MKKAVVALVTGAIALILVGAPGTASAQNPTAAGRVTAVTGSVTVARLAAPPQPLKVRDPLYWRDVVEARKDSMARVLLGGKTTVTVRELSRVELREEVRADGVRYTVELVTGKVRASVARVLMRPGEQVEVRTRNAVASVRGTDFVVETVERPTLGGAFGLLGAREVGEGIREGGVRSAETVVVTLSGVVEVSNRLAGTGRTERLRAYEAARISGQGGLARFQVKGDDLKTVLTGLTPPRPKEARSVATPPAPIVPADSDSAGWAALGVGSGPCGTRATGCSDRRRRPPSAGCAHGPSTRGHFLNAPTAIAIPLSGDGPSGGNGNSVAIGQSAGKGNVVAPVASGKK